MPLTRITAPRQQNAKRFTKRFSDDRIDQGHQRRRTIDYRLARQRIREEEAVL